jgi:hypothetical protein
MRQNPAYGALEIMHNYGPTGTIENALTSFQEGNIKSGIFYSTFALFELGWLQKISKVFKGEGGIGAIDNFTGIDSPTLNGINHFEGVRQGSINCVNAAISVAHCLKGRLVCAMGDNFAINGTGDVAMLLRGMFGKPDTYTKMDKMIDFFKNAGHGTSGIVTSIPANGSIGHAFNIINDSALLKYSMDNWVKKLKI